MFHQGLRIQDLQQERIRLHRDIYTMAQVLGVSLEDLKNYEIAEGVRLFSVDHNSEDYPGDTDTLGMISYFRHRELSPIRDAIRIQLYAFVIFIFR